MDVGVDREMGVRVDGGREDGLLLHPMAAVLPQERPSLWLLDMKSPASVRVLTLAMKWAVIGGSIAMRHFDGGGDVAYVWLVCPRFGSLTRTSLERRGTKKMSPAVRISPGDRRASASENSCRGWMEALKALTCMWVLRRFLDDPFRPFPTTVLPSAKIRGRGILGPGRAREIPLTGRRGTRESGVFRVACVIGVLVLSKLCLLAPGALRI